MSKIMLVDLGRSEVSQEQVEPGFAHYGRGLATHLLRRYVLATTPRHSPENCVVLVPGLLSGTAAPSTGRLTLAAKRCADGGCQFLNLAGPFAQKLGSLDIAAVMITGAAQEGPVMVHIDKDGARIIPVPYLKEKTVSDTIEQVRERFGKETAVVGIGPAGEHLLPLASVFTTYPQGIPLFNCVRGGMGDILGSKGLKAVAVSTSAYFAAPVVDRNIMKNSARRLARIIVDHPICGGALPAHGSITLMKIMKSGQLASLSASQAAEPTDGDTGQAPPELAGMTGSRINRSCAPLCVVRCLNRHGKGRARVFSSPAEREVSAALEHTFDIKAPDLSSELNRGAFELGIDSVEFVFACDLYFKTLKSKATPDDLRKALREIEKLTLMGRVLGSRTDGIQSLYKDMPELHALVTRPSIEEGKRFAVRLPLKLAGFENMDDRSYLYAGMIAQGNLGICLFTSFAIFESMEAWQCLAEMVKAKTGCETMPAELMRYAVECLQSEEEYELAAKQTAVQQGIPEFVKVLHRYFGNEVAQ
ncbi:MAG: hypothetical protein MJA84_17205 [Firmicutes bacterium]|nr:hypothetical protein [Bacillota bacterium]